MFPGFIYSAPIGTLGTGEVHLWRLSIEDVMRSQCLETLSKLLSDEEKNRLAAYRSESRRQIFIIGRAALRIILSAFMSGMPPESIGLTASAHGKPMLEDDVSQLQFNLSHSRDSIVIAVTRERLIGVDIEFMKARPTMADIASHYFHSHDMQAINYALQSEGYPSALRLFYKIWALKEAFIKADGKGMAIPGDCFYFKYIDQSNPCIEFTGYRSDVAKKWHFEHQFIDTLYSVALALALDVSERKDRIIVTQRQFSF
ncbi:MAG: 4'-phosphopantetheinyl transferase superfamily protein [Alteromonadaceae bacterium]|nr:4'-phosphopantetheinyl transferase superfamily protein [Alteromonadaceae bacterium]